MDRAAALELQRQGLTAFVRLFAASAERSALFERDGVIASIVPAVPDRSVINSVVYRDASSLGAALDDLARAYQEAGVHAWTVWVPEADGDAAALLEAAGHRLDASPMAMVLDLDRLGEPDRDGLDWDDEAALEDVARVNDLAYGWEVGTFGGALRRVPPGVPLRFYQARVDGHPACVLATIDDRDDCGIYMVATVKKHRGRGLARRLLHRALAEAPGRGLRTSSLQSTKFGYSVYERLGYEPICALEMWERRVEGWCGSPHARLAAPAARPTASSPARGALPHHAGCGPSLAAPGARQPHARNPHQAPGEYRPRPCRSTRRDSRRRSRRWPTATACARRRPR